MATRAEQARAQAERSGRGRPKRKRTKPRIHRAKTIALQNVDARTKAEAARATSGHFAGANTARRNVQADRGEHQTYDLEDSGNGRASRKSTRKAAHRSKPDSQLRRRQMRRVRAPKTRATSKSPKP
jgi:hypothetical protein